MFEDIFKIISETLPEAGVDCLLIGGFAVNHYGFTRNTLDVDFMIVSSDANLVRSLMHDAGFINIDERDNVMFCSKPEGGLRMDFLKVDTGTMRNLQDHASEVTLYGSNVRLPCLLDLIAMKIFALTQNTARRMAKDLPDIAYLTVLNHLDLEADIKPLCDRFGSPVVYDMIRGQIEELR